MAQSCRRDSRYLQVPQQGMVIARSRYLASGCGGEKVELMEKEPNTYTSVVPLGTEVHCLQHFQSLVHYTTRGRRPGYHFQCDVTASAGLSVRVSGEGGKPICSPRWNDGNNGRKETLGLAAWELKGRNTCSKQCTSTTVDVT